MAAVDAESELRNINYALQKCSQATYVPDSGSDLYTLKSFYSSRPYKQTNTRNVI